MVFKVIIRWCLSWWLGPFLGISVYLAICHVYRRYARYSASTCSSPVNLSFGPYWWLMVNNPPTKCRRRRVDPWVRKTPWSRNRQPTPVFLPGESHGQRSLVGYTPRGHKESDTTKYLTNINNDSPSFITVGLNQGGRRVEEKLSFLPYIVLQ